MKRLWNALFEIAATGTPKNLADLRKQMLAEGYDTRQLQGCSHFGQLRQILQKAKVDAEGT